MEEGQQVVESTGGIQNSVVEGLAQEDGESQAQEVPKNLDLGIVVRLASHGVDPAIPGDFTYRPA